MDYDLKWSNYITCPAEGGLLFNSYQVFTFQCTDIFNKVC